MISGKQLALGLGLIAVSLIGFGHSMTPCVNTASADIFEIQDDFNDGDLDGWEIKKGDYYNTGNSLMSSSDNYGTIWVADSVGLSQTITVDVYLTTNGPVSKSASVFLRAGDAGSGSNRYWDHTYSAYIALDVIQIQNHVARSHQEVLASETMSFAEGWHTLKFAVSGTGDDTRLTFWVDNIKVADVYDTTGFAHDDGGHLGLGSSNHIDRRVEYDNFYGLSYPIPHPGAGVLLAVGFGSLMMRRRR